ncbi:hypothetical protein JCM19376_30100 [Fusibacter bizertensis]
MVRTEIYFDLRNLSFGSVFLHIFEYKYRIYPNRFYGLKPILIKFKSEIGFAKRKSKHI